MLNSDTLLSLPTPHTLGHNYIFTPQLMKKNILLIWLLLSSSALLAQQKMRVDSSFINQKVTVLDENELPLIGVSVLLNNQPLGSTNLEGLIIFDARLGDTLSFQYLGYRSSKLIVAAAMSTKIQLQPTAALISTIAVVGRRNEDPNELPYRIETIDKQSIELLQSATSADAIADLSGVYVQKSQFGGGSPVVRGLEANRVLLVIDGVRMNNAIFRSGHLQNAITIDVNALNQMELIYGPGSLAYGSDALGGVIHFRTLLPSFTSSSRWKVNGGLQYASAAQSKSLSAGLEYGQPNFASYTQISLSDFGDLRAGNKRPQGFESFGRRNQYVERINGIDTSLVNPKPNLQIGTAYQQFDLLQKLRWKLKKEVELQANLQLSSSSNIPRYDNLTEVRNGQLRWAEWNYGPQNRVLASLRLNNTSKQKWYDGYSLIVSHQFVEEDRIRRRNGNPLRETSEVDVHSSNLQLDFKRYFTDRQRMHFGIDARFDLVNSSAFLTDIDSQQIQTDELPSRYPSQGSSLATAGAYADYRYQLHQHWTAQAGLRFSHQWLTATFGADDPIEWPENYLAGITNTAGAFTAAASLRYRKNGHHLRMLFAQGFRAPNVDDYAKFRERNGFIQVPNPDLGNERSNSVELGYDLDKKGWQLSVAAYYTWLNNAIIRSDFQLPDGRNSFVSFGDTLLVQANVNAESARIYGVDLSLSKKLGDQWQLAGEVHWLRGRRDQVGPDDKLFVLPQDHIPPVYGSVALNFQQNKWRASLRWRFQAAKSVDDYAVGAIEQGTDGLVFDRLGTSDNLELTPVDPSTGSYTGSYAWSTLNINSRFQISKRLSITAGVENIFDVHYRTFASGVSAAGRNFLVGLRFR